MRNLLDEGIGPDDVPESDCLECGQPAHGHSLCIACAPGPDAADAAERAALERARERGIRVARLSADAYRAQSAEPQLRGPYLVLDSGDGELVCQCLAGAYQEMTCHHRAAVAAALAGAYPWHAPEQIVGPGELAPTRETRTERRLREIAEYDAVQAARRAQVTVTAADYAAFWGE